MPETVNGKLFMASLVIRVNDFHAYFKVCHVVTDTSGAIRI